MELESQLNSWRIEFLLNVGSFRGKIEIEDLRSIILRSVPLEMAPTSTNGIGYHLEWDYALTPDPDIHFLHPYISWTDKIALKPGSHLILFGQKVLIEYAIIYGNTRNHLRAIMKRNGKPTKEAREDEVFFSVNKNVGPGEFLDPAFDRLSQQLFRIEN